MTTPEDKSWQVRPARLVDLDRLTDLLAELFAIEADFQIDAVRQRRGLRLMLEAPQACLLVAEAEGLVLGMASGQLTISTAEGGPALLVEDVIVEPSWRGRGIGRCLIRELGEWAASHGAHRLQLLADQHNVAGLDFYRKIGWQVTALLCLRTTAPTAAPAQSENR